MPGDEGAGLTRHRLMSDLHAAGVAPGQILLVHASMRSLGRVAGGAATVVSALREAIGPQGTLVVPTGTAGNSDTSQLFQASTAGLTAAQIERYKAAMPPFDAATTASHGMGAIAELVRTSPGAYRSAHPQSSFAAIGPRAREVTAGHAIDCHLGESSPLGRLYEFGACFLLLGVDYAACSAFHLAEYRYIAHPPTRSYRCVIKVNGEAAWHEYDDVVLDDRDHGDLGADFDQTGQVTRGRVGHATTRLASVRLAVDFAAEWLRLRRVPAGFK